MKEYNLKNGVTVIDRRGDGKSFEFKNLETKFMVIHYSTSDGFYIRNKVLKLKTDDTDEYQKELKLVIQTIDEIQSTINFVQDDDTTVDFNDIMPPKQLINPDCITDDDMTRIKKLVIEYSKVYYSNLSKDDVNQIIDTIKNEPSFIVRQNVVAYLVDDKLDCCFSVDDQNIVESENISNSIVGCILLSFTDEMNEILTYTNNLVKRP